MELQQILALAVVAGSAAYLVRKTILKRKRAAQTACADDCGCSTSDPAGQIPGKLAERTLTGAKRH
ncbi:MAG TPA: hypothetical protein VMM57_08160 [Bacteroidota bacterium]|nr:hypothetical protein [Bacteroidota bacterium]